MSRRVSYSHDFLPAKNLPQKQSFVLHAPLPYVRGPKMTQYGSDSLTWRISIASILGHFEVHRVFICNSVKHSKNAIKCTHQGCKYTTEMRAGSLTDHCKTKHRWGVHKCSKCDFTTYREGPLNAHIKRVHVAQKTKTEFHCNICDHYYKHSQALREHYRDYHQGFHR